MHEDIEIKTIMSTNVICTSPDRTVRELSTIMKDNSISTVLVTDENRKLLGIVTERDIVRKVVSMNLSPDKIKVDEIMTKDVIVGSPDMIDSEVAVIFIDKNIKTLPILEDEQLKGIVTQTDMVKFLAGRW